jgi:integrase
MGKLTARRVEALTKKGRHHDGNNLALQINANGSKSWLFLFMLNGRCRQMGLGSLDLVSLADARDLAFESRKLLRSGVDPIEHRNTERAKQLGSMTFKECAEQCIEARAAGWRNPKAKSQWENSLKAYAFPVIGDLPVGMIDTPHVLKILQPIWSTKSETANRVRSRIEIILDFAKVRKLRTGENPARWQGNLKLALPAKEKVRRVEHHPALPYAEMAPFMMDLRGREGVAARALEFTILTAARTNETTGAKWSEFDLKNRVWTVPASRTKTKQEHRVPLVAAVVDLLTDLPREKSDEPDHDGFVFIGMRADQPLSNMAMLATLKRMKRSDVTVHGFRSSFKDWASEATNYPDNVSEMALSHLVSDNVQAAYRRGDLFKKRERLMADWAKHCLATPKARRGDNVAPVRAVA